MARAVTVSIKFVDGKGKASSTKIYFATGATIANYIGAVQAAAQAMANVSNCRITGASICIPIDITSGTLKAVAEVGADIWEKGLMLFTTAIAGLKAKFKLPTWDETRTIAGTDVIDPADTGVAALITVLELGYATTTPATVLFANSRDKTIDQFDKGRELFRSNT